MHPFLFRLPTAIEEIPSDIYNGERQHELAYAQTVTSCYLVATVCILSHLKLLRAFSRTVFFKPSIPVEGTFHDKNSQTHITCQ